jgi:hypothetical protein
MSRFDCILNKKGLSHQKIVIDVTPRKILSKSMFSNLAKTKSEE